MLAETNHKIEKAIKDLKDIYLAPIPIPSIDPTPQLMTHPDEGGYSSYEGGEGSEKETETESVGELGGLEIEYYSEMGLV